MKRQEIRNNVYWTLFLAVGVPILVGRFLTDFYSIRYANIPLHSGLEVSGGTIAVIISLMIFIKYQRMYILTHLNYTAFALFAMGIIDIFHGIVMPGKIFVWLHSTAVFFGGLFFILVWAKEIKVSQRLYKYIPMAVIAFAILFSLLSMAFSEYIPAMFNKDRTFSDTANWLNVIGGVGFFIASLKFFQKYVQTQDLEELLFAGHTLLFGVAGILFISSVLWGAQWWLWHVLRLFAYVIALYFLYVEFNRDINMIGDKNQELNNAQIIP